MWGAGESARVRVTTAEMVSLASSERSSTSGSLSGVAEGDLGTAGEALADGDLGTGDVMEAALVVRGTGVVVVVGRFGIE